MRIGAAVGLCAQAVIGLAIYALTSHPPINKNCLLLRRILLVALIIIVIHKFSFIKNSYYKLILIQNKSFDKFCN